MPDLKAKNRAQMRQQIPRIEDKDAGRIFEDLEHLTDGSSEFPDTLRTKGFAQFLSQLDESLLRLAVQPDSWGERTRARLVSVAMAGLKGTSAECATVADIVEVSNIVTPCFLLELGRRKQHLAVEFPNDPFDPGSCFRLSVAPSRPMHSITNDDLSRLVTEVGEDLVGLCYFGDPQSRDIIEALLNQNDVVRTRPCRNPSSATPKEK
jgi:hypothetical protein